MVLIESVHGGARKARAFGEVHLARALVAIALVSAVACSGADVQRGPAPSEARRCGTREVRALDDVALDAFRHDEVTSSRLDGLHRRWRINELAATAGGGFVIAGGGSQLTLDSTGCPQTQYAPDVLFVDDEFEVRWRWPAPPQVSVAAIAAHAEGGAVATFLTHRVTSLGQLEIDGQAVGVLHLDGTGQLTWTRLLALGYLRRRSASRS
jgi:hypothetical protein